MSARKGLVTAWGRQPPFSLGWMKPLGAWDSGFTVLLDDAPEPEELDEDESVTDHPGIRTMRLACLLEDHPEIGQSPLCRRPEDRPRLASIRMMEDAKHAFASMTLRMGPPAAEDRPFSRGGCDSPLT